MADSTNPAPQSHPRQAAVPREPADAPRPSLRPAPLAAAVLGVFLAAGATGFAAVRSLTAQPRRAPAVAKSPDARLDLASPRYDAFEFGGRNLPWWRARLKALRADATPDGQARYALTLQRARALKLDVRERSGGEVTVQLTRELALSVHKRLAAP